MENNTGKRSRWKEIKEGIPQVKIFLRLPITLMVNKMSMTGNLCQFVQSHIPALIYHFF